MADGFGLSNLRDGVKNKADELSEDANVRSYDDRGRADDGPFKPFTFQQEDFDRTEPDKDDMRKYWRQFETTPFVRKSITSFARQVMEPGYYIQARGLDEEQLTDLDKWLTQAAIIEGEPGQDFRLSQRRQSSSKKCAELPSSRRLLMGVTRRRLPDSSSSMLRRWKL